MKKEAICFAQLYAGIISKTQMFSGFKSKFFRSSRNVG